MADRAAAELGRLGGRAPSPHALTESERRIAEHVAAGLTNKEVAGALFLTVSTVEAALWKIYRKLDVRSRTELVARLSGAPTRADPSRTAPRASPRPDSPDRCPR